MSDEQRFQKLRDNPILFAEKVLDFHPFAYQEKLLSDGSLRIVSCMGRQTGKTTTIAVKALHFAYANPRTTTLIVSPSLRQSMILFDRIVALIYNNEWLPTSVVRKTRTVIQLDNESQIIALPCSENFLRGYTAHLLIIDEAAFLPETTLTNILFPMLATTQGTLILLSTPWGKNHFFYRAFMDPDFSAHRVKSSECPLIKPQFLEKQQRLMTREAYAMEYEAEFQEAATSYFLQDLIRSCIDPALELRYDLENLTPESGDYYAGVDIGKLQDHSVIVVVKQEKDMVRLVFLKEFPLETPYSHVIGFIVKANQKFSPRKILIDKSGAGEAVVEEIGAQGLSNAESKSFTMQSKAEMLAHLRIKMEQRHFRMPYNHRLCQQINSQQYEYTKTGQIRFWHPKNSHDDQLWALALATYATKETTKGVLARAW